MKLDAEVKKLCKNGDKNVVCKRGLKLVYENSKFAESDLSDG